MFDFVNLWRNLFFKSSRGPRWSFRKKRTKERQAIHLNLCTSGYSLRLSHLCHPSKRSCSLQLRYGVIIRKEKGACGPYPIGDTIWKKYALALIAELKEKIENDIAFQSSWKYKEWFEVCYHCSIKPKCTCTVVMLNLLEQKKSEYLILFVWRLFRLNKYARFFYAPVTLIRDLIELICELTLPKFSCCPYL